MAGRTTTKQPADLARELQLEVCVERLLGQLFPATSDIPDRPGRHQVLTDVIARAPALKRALLADDPDAARQAWSTCLTEHTTDLRFLHTLAVLYREHALTDLTQDDGTRLVFATALWALLLSTPEFWHHTGERVAEYQTELADTVSRELFGLHATAGRAALADGRTDAAGTHLRCLAAAGSGPDALVDILVGLGLPYQADVDQPLWSSVSAVATTALDKWAADLVRAAEKIQTDADAIAELPTGISSNWSGGIDHLRPFVDLGVPVAQVLRTGLQWHTDWCFDLYRQQETDRIRTVLDSAGRFAEPLMPLCVKGHGHLPENQALSGYFLFRGFVAPKVATARAEYETALEWNPSNENAEELRQGSQVRELMVAGREAFHQKWHSKALDLLREALTLVDDTEQQTEIREYMATVHNSAGVSILEQAKLTQGKFDKALDEVMTALKAKMAGKPDAATMVAGLDAAKRRGADCAVCRKSGLINRILVVNAVYDEAKATGVFQTTADTFWRGYTHLMCGDCTTALNDVKRANGLARAQFLAAIRMNPQHPTAKKNLAAVDRMGDL